MLRQSSRLVTAPVEEDIHTHQLLRQCRCTLLTDHVRKLCRVIDRCIGNRCQDFRKLTKTGDNRIRKCRRTNKLSTLTIHVNVSGVDAILNRTQPCILNLRCDIRLADMHKHHHRREEEPSRICDILTRNVWCTAVNRLEHRATGTNIRTWGKPDRACDLCGNVTHDVAIQVTRQNHIKLLRRIGEARSPDIDNHVRALNVLVLQRNFIHNFVKETIGHLHDVVFGERCHSLTVMRTGIFESKACNTLTARAGDQLETLDTLIRLAVLNTAIEVFLIFPDDDDIHFGMACPHKRCIRHARTHICVQSQALTECHIETFIPAALRRGDRPLQENSSPVDGFPSIRCNPTRKSALVNGLTDLDVLELKTCIRRRQNSKCRGHDLGPDAIPMCNCDPCLLHLFFLPACHSMETGRRFHVPCSSLSDTHYSLLRFSVSIHELFNATFDGLWNGVTDEPRAAVHFGVDKVLTGCFRLLVRDNGAFVYRIDHPCPATDFAHKLLIFGDRSELADLFDIVNDHKDHQMGAELLTNFVERRAVPVLLIGEVDLVVDQHPVDSLPCDDIEAALRKNLLQLLITLHGLVVALTFILFAAAIDDRKHDNFSVLGAQREAAVRLTSTIVDQRSVF